MNVGQMLWCGWDVSGMEYQVNEHATSLVDDMCVGGIVLEERNITASKPLRIILEELQIRAASSGLPRLFLAVDQEGGSMTRLSPPHFPVVRSAAEIGLTGDPAQARSEAHAVGILLKNHGFNVNLAPVLDVLADPANSLIGVRSFGRDPSIVSEMGSSATRGFQDDAGIMACGKHFPGHGSTSDAVVDGLFSSPRTLQQLRDIDFAPFRAAIDAGIASIMVSHLMFPEIAADTPTTMSHQFITRLLREELGFGGLIVIECMEAANGYRWATMRQKVVGAIQAGADIISCCHWWDMQVEVFESLRGAVESGEISRSRLQESFDRIAAAKARWVPQK
jgi:beta-N-acetylhexosaminidase